MKKITANKIKTNLSQKYSYCGHGTEWVFLTEVRSATGAVKQ